MRRLLTVICTLLLSASVSGQQIKSRPVGFDDFRSLLEAAGYEAFGFDLSELLEGPGRYDMTVYIKEYESGVEIRSREFPCGPNKLLVSDFPEKVRGEILPGEMADPQAGIYMLAKKLTIGFYPSGTDSTAMLNFSIPEMREASQRLSFRSVTSSSGYTLTKYCTRPFGIDSVRGRKVHSAGLLRFDVVRCGAQSVPFLRRERDRARPVGRNCRQHSPLLCHRY